MTESSSFRRSLAEELAGQGRLTDAAWWTAFEAVPRELFLDGAVFRPRGTRWEPVRREQLGDEEWLRMVYANTTWVTQVDGLSAASAQGPTTGRPTSSSTLPSLVLRMLELAEIREGDKVLEIGTGTGYSTAIMCRRLGEESVYSIEYDEALAAAASRHLRAAAVNPHLIVGDGMRGHQPGADYDAIVATCAVRTIPPSWLWQLRDGGSITTTISGWMLASGLIRLDVDEEGTARGRFTGDKVSYMLARSHERPPRPVFYPHAGDTRPSLVSPELLDDWTAHFVAQLAAPSAELAHLENGVVLVDAATGSQAWTEPDGDGWTVHQDGPLRLWDQVEEALAVWQGAGSPDQTAFGMTVTEWDQKVWLGEPDGACWRLPT
ncbi:ATP-grasp peptide maturase system methyltransferase [Streptomyces sp. TS71-3]|uniref:ATP-grasp peptide maturase system methyltransferase n=1 Tax=Streptomyces sp. TS71-3 TaxID=2733862 RepID=UPI001B149784|nr:ATP-grasp peptide maturase system methyltransferase [Streptomyces sp. TS71-3]GHJ36626.1 SAM-dependent methyltransferase [Streptomyces sp. TS71-3]